MCLLQQSRLGQPSGGPSPQMPHSPPPRGRGWELGYGGSLFPPDTICSYGTFT